MEFVKQDDSNDENMLCLMITALSRDWDTKSIVSTLPRVWGVDVESLLTGSEVEPLPVKDYSRDFQRSILLSPLSI